MRDIKFRGKRVDTGEWVCGEFHHRREHTGSKNRPGISFDDGENGWWHEIIPETLGQSTGLTDKNEVGIYEGDKIRKVPDEWPSKPEIDSRTLDEYLISISHIWDVVFHQSSKFLLTRHIGYNPWETDDDGFTYCEISAGRHGSIEVIGNIHDNPELLKP